jgi:hypothetical protein
MSIKLYYKTIQVTEGHKYFPRMPHAAREPQVGPDPSHTVFGQIWFAALSPELALKIILKPFEF